MERNKIYIPLTDKELVQKAYWWIDELIKSGGKAFVMHIPARLDHDTDLVLFNVTKRFDNLLDKYAELKEKCDRFEALIKKIYKDGAGNAEGIKEVNEALSAGEGEKEVENEV